jgi:hypothetical protein
MNTELSFDHSMLRARIHKKSPQSTMPGFIKPQFATLKAKPHRALGCVKSSMTATACSYRRPSFINQR